MSTTLETSLLELIALDDALPRVLTFTRRFGRQHARLAMHAALPLGLTPELLHLLRTNFVPRAPFIAEADLLLSPLCREVGGDIYEMDASVRELLLSELHESFGRHRVTEVADFLVLYATRRLRDTADADVRAHLRAQQWVALAYSHPELAAEELAGALRTSIDAGDAREAGRVARLAGTLTVPLLGHPELIQYAAGIQQLTDGSAEAAYSRFDDGGGIAQEVVIGRVTLPQPSVAFERLGLTATVAQTNVGVESSQAVAAEVSSGYRVAKVVVVGDPTSGKAEIISALTGMDAGGGARASVWRIPSSAAAPQLEGDVAFVTDEADLRIPLEFTLQRAALILITVRADGGAREPAERWLQRVIGALGGATPPMLLVATGADEYPHQDVTYSQRELIYLADARPRRLQGAVVVGREIDVLRERILAAINWDRMPGTGSRTMYERIEQYLPGQLQQTPPAIDLASLLDAAFPQESTAPSQSLPNAVAMHTAEEWRFEEATAALRVAEALDRVHVLPSQNPTIVGHELFAAMVQSTIDQAAGRNDTSAMPVLNAGQVRQWAFAGRADTMLGNVKPGVASAVFSGIVDALVKSGLAVRANTRDGEHLVFPSLFDPPDDAEWDVWPDELLVGIRWKGGSAGLAYFLLLVQLEHLGGFRERRIASNYSRFVLPGGERIAVLGEASGGEAELKLLAASDAYAYRTSARLNLREEPSPGARVTSVLPSGARVLRISEVENDRSWWRVTTDAGAIGFVQHSFLTVDTVALEELASFVRQVMPQCLREGTAFEFIEPPARPQPPEVVEPLREVATALPPYSDSVMTLLVTEDRNGLEAGRLAYQLTSRGRIYQLFYGPPITQRDAWFSELYHRAEASRDWLNDLWPLALEAGNALMPSELLSLIWSDESLSNGIQLVTDVLDIPWELVGASDPRTGEKRFLGEYIIRSLPISDARQQLPIELELRDWSYLGVPTYGDLNTIAAEGTDFEFVRSVLRPHGLEPSRITTRANVFYTTISRGEIDALHIATNSGIDAESTARQRNVPDAIAFEEPTGPWTLDPMRVASAARFEDRHPLIFMDTPASARSGSWPRAFLRAGAGAFVGSTWAPTGRAVKQFVRAFYDSLLSGQTLVTATSSARSRASSISDASWLSFQVYGRAEARRSNARPTSA